MFSLGELTLIGQYKPIHKNIDGLDNCPSGFIHLLQPLPQLD